MDSSLVASARMLDAPGTPAENALVGIDAMNAGKRGGAYGCTGVYLVGN